MHENKFGVETQMTKEKVPKWNRDAYDDKVRQTLTEIKKGQQMKVGRGKSLDLDML